MNPQNPRWFQNGDVNTSFKAKYEGIIERKRGRQKGKNQIKKQRKGE
jgi:hypothetical protein